MAVHAPFILEFSWNCFFYTQAQWKLIKSRVRATIGYELGICRWVRSKVLDVLFVEFISITSKKLIRAQLKFD